MKKSDKNKLIWKPKETSDNNYNQFTETESNEETKTSASASLKNEYDKVTKYIKETEKELEKLTSNPKYDVKFLLYDDIKHLLNPFSEKTICFNSEGELKIEETKDEKAAEKSKQMIKENNKFNYGHNDSNLALQSYPNRVYVSSPENKEINVYYIRNDINEMKSNNISDLRNNNDDYN